MNELKMKEIYDNCTEEKQKQWDVITKFHHFQAESKAREETKREIQKLWLNWPDRKEFPVTDIGTGALCFYVSLQNSNDPILSDGDFGSGDPYQIIHPWVLEWAQTWGKKQ